MGELINWLKEKYPSQKICLLTNGTLIGYNGMPQELKNLDLIIPSLDASDENSFQKINRPVEELTHKKLISSIKNFRIQNKCQMWLELFVVPGVNDTDQSIANFAKIISEINPDKIQLNGLDRPGVEKWVKKPEKNILEKFVNALKDIAPVEIIVRQNIPDYKSSIELQMGNISNLLSKRPCTFEEIQKIFSLSDNELNQVIQELISLNEFEIEENQSGKFIKRKNH
ncbi:MAG TPA: hypothetical protein P5239_05475 [Victivallales bacterium]|nr:hypothetical protein [Victivallales bacterium]